jgi:hypothetical protein
MLSIAVESNLISLSNNALSELQEPSMQYYRYWAKANSTQLRPNNYPVTAWGYSNVSQADAEHLALQRADAKVSQLKQQPTDEELMVMG